MSAVTKLQLHFCKFHHKLKDSSMSAMKRCLDTINVQPKHKYFKITTVGIGERLVCQCLQSCGKCQVFSSFYPVSDCSPLEIMTVAEHLQIFIWTESSFNVLFEYAKKNYLKRSAVTNILNIVSLKKCRDEILENLHV